MGIIQLLGQFIVRRPDTVTFLSQRHHDGTSNDKVLTHDYACALSRLMNMDRFDAPIKNVAPRET
jgi:hypothetical protein